MSRQSNNKEAPALQARSRWMGLRPLSIAGLLLAAFAIVVSAQRARGGEPEDGTKIWKEIEEVTLPAYPKADALLSFTGGGASTHQFFIDPQSLSIGPDGVVRYTLVVKTAGGATNVTYEGVRCEMRHQKIYAVGRANGSWTRTRDPQWRRIEYQTVNNHHGVLYSDYLCQEREPAKSVKELVQRLRWPPSRPITGD